MATKVVMPALGESVEEATITRWLKAEGDPVEEYEPLVEVNTDKVDTEIPSPASGVVLRILVAEEATIQTGAALAWIGQPGESMTEMEQADAETPQEPVPADGPVKLTHPAADPGGEMRPGRHDGLGFISPVVARMASEHKLDLAVVPGTGKGGRITKRDVLAYLERRSTAIPQAGEKMPAEPVAADSRSPDVQHAARPGDVLPLSTIRRSIAEHMVRSKHTSPHVTTVMEADMSAVVAHRAANSEDFARSGAKLTYTPYLIAAIVAACKAFPIVNSSWHENGVALHQEINVGMATALEQDGLIVPVIHQADSLSLLGLARIVNDLASRARGRQLKPDEVQGGTITLTNHGTSGSLFATPIINQPQCAIVGAGIIQKRVVVINDAIAIRPMVYLSLTFDHRILDGATGDHFLALVKQTLENWK